MHTIKSRGKSNGKRGEGKLQMEEREEMSVDMCQKRSEKEGEGIIKYPTADVKSGRKMHQVPCS